VTIDGAASERPDLLPLFPNLPWSMGASLPLPGITSRGAVPERRTGHSHRETAKQHGMIPYGSSSQFNQL